MPPAWALYRLLLPPAPRIASACDCFCKASYPDRANCKPGLTFAFPFSIFNRRFASPLRAYNSDL